MMYHENRLLADDSHEISFLFFENKEKTLQDCSSAAVLICALRVNNIQTYLLSKHNNGNPLK